MKVKLLLNPFEKYTESQLLTVGSLAMLVGSVLAYVFGARFDGAIDVHFSEYVRIYQPFFDNLFNILCLSFALWIAGKYINDKTRMIDILVTVMVARVPFYFIPLFNINNFISDITDSLLNNEAALRAGSFPDISMFDLAVLLVFAVISIAFFLWFVILLYSGFKTATNSKTATHKLYFAFAIVCAEIVTKIILVYSR